MYLISGLFGANCFGIKLLALGSPTSHTDVFDSKVELVPAFDSKVLAGSSLLLLRTAGLTGFFRRPVCKLFIAAATDAEVKERRLFSAWPESRQAIFGTVLVQWKSPRLTAGLRTLLLCFKASWRQGAMQGKCQGWTVRKYQTVDA